MIIITGASGHIGNNLVRLLIKEGTPFKVLLRKDSTELSGLSVDSFIGNLYDPSFYALHIDKNDTVIHIAGFIDLLNKDYEQSYQANVVMTQCIANICLDKGARLIYISSTDVFRFSKEKGNYIETNTNTIKYYYPKTKTLATLYIKDLQDKGLNALILYPTAVIGIHDFKGSRAGKEIIKASKKTFLPYVKGGYDFIDVLDVVKAIFNACNTNIQGDIILSGTYLTIKDIYKLVSRIVKKHRILIFIPKWLAKFFIRFIPGLSPMMIDIVSTSRPFFDERMALLIHRKIDIYKTFYHIIYEHSV